jgi:DNA-binding transcriptional ArsR family regulator
VGEIATCCPVDMSVVSRHLRSLRDAGIVVCEKRGREVRCRVAVERLVDTLRKLADAIEEGAASMTKTRARSRKSKRERGD